MYFEKSHKLQIIIHYTKYFTIIRLKLFCLPHIFNFKYMYFLQFDTLLLMHGCHSVSVAEHPTITNSTCGVGPLK